jgi:hypothetical protein
LVMHQELSWMPTVFVPRPLRRALVIDRTQMHSTAFVE